MRLAIDRYTFFRLFPFYLSFLYLSFSHEIFLSYLCIFSFAFNTTNFFLDLPVPLIDLFSCSIFFNSHSLCLTSLFFFPLASWKPSSPLLPPFPSILPIILLLYLRLLLFTSAIGKSFAFVEFSTHQFAKSVVEASVRRGISLKGRTISVGEWRGQTMEHMEDSNWVRE